MYRKGQIGQVVTYTIVLILSVLLVALFAYSSAVLGYLAPSNKEVTAPLNFAAQDARVIYTLFSEDTAIVDGEKQKVIEVLDQLPSLLRDYLGRDRVEDPEAIEAKYVNTVLALEQSFKETYSCDGRNRLLVNYRTDSGSGDGSSLDFTDNSAVYWRFIDYPSEPLSLDKTVLQSQNAKYFGKYTGEDAPQQHTTYRGFYTHQTDSRTLVSVQGKWPC